MNASDRPQFFKVLGGVYDFYGRDLSAFAGQVWWQSCERFDFEQVTKAFSAHLMDAEHGSFLPKPANLVRVLQGTRTDRSLMAWAKVFDAVQRVGAYTSVCFDDGRLGCAVPLHDRRTAVHAETLLRHLQGLHDPRGGCGVSGGVAWRSLA